MKETPAEAAAILAKGSAALENLFSQLSADAAEARGTIGSGAWSTRDLAGHIETWEEVALRTIEDIRAGRPPSLRNSVTDEASLDLFNAAAVERKAGRGWEEMLTSFRTTNAELVETVRSMPTQEWEQMVPAAEGRPEQTLGETVGSSTGMPEHPFRHAWAHMGDLKTFVDAATVGPKA
jgi:hypothetical protein